MSAKPVPAPGLRSDTTHTRCPKMQTERVRGFDDKHGNPTFEDVQSFGLCNAWLRCDVHGGCVVCGWTGVVETSWGAATPCACMEGLR